MPGYPNGKWPYVATGQDQFPMSTSEGASTHLVMPTQIQREDIGASNEIFTRKNCSPRDRVLKSLLVIEESSDSVALKQYDTY
jgi:hypothetical protein